MISLRPSLASYSRVAYARELVGDREGAVGAMELALGSAATEGAPHRATGMMAASTLRTAKVRLRGTDGLLIATRL